MKIFQNTLYAAMLFSLAAGCSRKMSPQSGKEAAKAGNVEEMVTMGNFVFKAQTVLPMAGRVRHLTSSYDVKVSKDSLVAAWLPYFGRAYTAPLDPSKGGIMFKSKDFSYTVSEGNNGGWNVDIQPHDVNNTRRLSFSIFGNGNASLQVTSNHRQPISFNGRVEELKEEGQ